MLTNISTKNIPLTEGITSEQKSNNFANPVIPIALILSKRCQLLRKKKEKSVSALILTDSQNSAERLLNEITFFNPKLKISLFPDWEMLPYEPFSPHEDLVSDRLLTLYKAVTGDLDVIVVSAQTAVMKLLPKEFLAGNTFFFKEHQKIDIEALKRQVQIAGYCKNQHVISPGEYALRGNIIDLFPMGSQLPYRIELFDKEIETIRVFDPDSQRSIHTVKDVRILPSREFDISKKTADYFRSTWRSTFEGDPSKCPLYKDVGNQIFGAGIEFYLPFLHENLSSIFSYIDSSATVFKVGEVNKAMESQVEEINDRYRYLHHDMERPVCDPSSIALKKEFWLSAFKEHTTMAVEDLFVKEEYLKFPDISINTREQHDLKNFNNAFSEKIENKKILIVADNIGRAETIKNLFTKDAYSPIILDTFQAFEKYKLTFPNKEKNLFIIVGDVLRGFESRQFILITEFDLYSSHYQKIKKTDKKNEKTVENLLKNLSELQVGSPVVHIDHGIGKYRGLKHVNLGDGENEFLHLEYANEATLYVPVSQLDKINRYCGADPDHAPIHILGSERWNKEKKKAVKQVRDTAAKLLELYAVRATKKGIKFNFDSQEFNTFCQGFQYIETTDQNAAIQSVIQDMISEKPMDRLICGDVGFGKTEVALRASFLAISSNKQVAVLTPTTLLAEQHFQTFKDRFSSLPVEIRELSRFRKKSEIQESINLLKAGKIDIVVGTHKLIMGNIQFKDLGLIIIDEEHRFGVRQKEKFREIRSEIDTLAMTATPIPRTLAMSMEGIRDFSIIATAPQKRLAIKTFVREEDDFYVREALYRELRRGGQAYVIHNEVKTIHHKLSKLEKLVPESRITVAHGQMPEKELETVMRSFNQKQFNILLCSTIIETGIDIPSANTIIIYRADKFGLAQLHQLRGRVGRSHHQAYAYLLTPDEKSITTSSKKRLNAIQSMEELGSGFFLAMHDLEIRGAGEVLGENQSGNITEIGFSLYAEMLENAVRFLKEKKPINENLIETSKIDINLHMPALLPKTYCPDINERLIIYKKLSESTNIAEINEMEEELIDRFGLIPLEAKTLLLTHKVRIKSIAADLVKLDMTEDSIIGTFAKEPKIDIDVMLDSIKKDNSFKITGPNQLKYFVSNNSLASYQLNSELFFSKILGGKITLDY